MDITLFESLIGKPEGRMLDFKVSSYDFHGNKEAEDAKFIKDILSFCNTQRTEAAFIITGIAEEKGVINLIGVDRFHDDSILQQKAMDKIWPKPVFSSYLFPYKEKLYGIIEFPIHPYDRPLVSTKILKGVIPDTLYIRRGSSNSLASASEIMNLIDWLNAIRLTGKEMNLLKDEAGLILSALSNTLTPLSGNFSRMLLYGRSIGNSEIVDFCTGELNKYKINSGNPKKYKFRVIQVPATPYEITFSRPSWSVSQVLNEISTMEEFNEVNFFFNYPILELERMLADITAKDGLFQLKIPYKQIFPDVTSNVKNATLYFSPIVLSSLYTSIRNYAIGLMLDQVQS